MWRAAHDRDWIAASLRESRRSIRLAIDCATRPWSTCPSAEPSARAHNFLPSLDARAKSAEWRSWPVLARVAEALDSVTGSRTWTAAVTGARGARSLGLMTRRAGLSLPALVMFAVLSLGASPTFAKNRRNTTRHRRRWRTSPLHETSKKIVRIQESTHLSTDKELQVAIGRWSS